jgi:hypothetical protein
VPCPELTCFRVIGGASIPQRGGYDDAGIERITRLCPRLTVLAIDAPKMTDVGARHIAERQGAQLTSLHLRGAGCCTTEGLVELISHCRNLRSILLPGQATTEVLLAAVKLLPNLQVVKIQKIEGMPAGPIEHLLVHCPQLLSYCNNNLSMQSSKDQPPIPLHLRWKFTMEAGTIRRRS